MSSVLGGKFIEHSARNDCLELGFVEKTDPWHLMSYQLPCKIGGRPAWLGLDKIPIADDLKCSLCGTQMVFLLQIYCPIDEREDCYHRSLFVFMCRRGSCYTNADDSRPLKVFRCQLPRENPFYRKIDNCNEDPTLEEVKELWKQSQISHVSQFNNICDVCGCLGNFKCAACQQVYYCCKEHQTIGWKTAGHKEICRTLQSRSLTYDPVFNFSSNTFLLPEYDLYLGPDPEAENRGHDESNQDLKMDDIAIYDSNNSDIDELEKIARRETKEDKIFLKFQNEIKCEPEQVLRYARGGSPLWISSKAINDCSGIIPPCPHCGQKRIFEFQVTPQLLHFLRLNGYVTSGKLPNDSHSMLDLEITPDWGCLYVFTCQDSCEPKTHGSYVQEFIVRHDIG